MTPMLLDVEEENEGRHGALLHLTFKTCCLQSDIVLVDPEHGTEESRLRSVGTHAHGLVLWRDGIVTLDSEGSALVVLEPSSGSKDIIWKVNCPRMHLLCPTVSYEGIALLFCSLLHEITLDEESLLNMLSGIFKMATAIHETCSGPCYQPDTSRQTWQWMLQPS